VMITVLEKEQDIDFIFGLDMLRRHQCCIDLPKNALVIGSVGVELPFLSESEIGKTPFGGAASTETPSSAETPSAASAPDEGKIERLMSLGFSRQRVVEALEATDGNEEFAGSLLFG
jgi:DNA damage-inducible protein 1